MKLGVYAASLADKTLDEALGIVADLGFTSIEVNTGGFVPAPHIPNRGLQSMPLGGPSRPEIRCGCDLDTRVINAFRVQTNAIPTVQIQQIFGLQS